MSGFGYWVRWHAETRVCLRIVVVFNHQSQIKTIQQAAYQPKAAPRRLQKSGISFLAQRVSLWLLILPGRLLNKYFKSNTFQYPYSSVPMQYWWLSATAKSRRYGFRTPVHAT